MTQGEFEKLLSGEGLPNPKEEEFFASEEEFTAVREHEERSLLDEVYRLRRELENRDRIIKILRKEATRLKNRLELAFGRIERHLQQYHPKGFRIVQQKRKRLNK